MHAVGNQQTYCFSVGSLTHTDLWLSFLPPHPPLVPHVPDENYLPFKFPLELFLLTYPKDKFPTPPTLCAQLYSVDTKSLGLLIPFQSNLFIRLMPQPSPSNCVSLIRPVNSAFLRRHGKRKR